MPNLTTATKAATTSSPATKAQTAAPFIIGSRNASRLSFTIPTVQLGSGLLAQTPISIPAVGYIKSIDLDVTIAITGGTTPALVADAPFTVFSMLELRNSSGNDLITPMTGYQWYLLNKYGCQDWDAPFSDPKVNATYNSTTTGIHFTLQIPCEISPYDTFGTIPALASNRSYQLQVTYNALANLISGSPTANVTTTATVNYWTEPTAQSLTGAAQATAPKFNGTVNLWQYEAAAVTPGDKWIKSNNVGNVLRTLIFTLRNSSGVRVSADWPAVCELYLDNDPMFYLPLQLWQTNMSRWFHLSNAIDTVGGLDTGVFVIPFYALATGKATANARRSQYLPTLDTSLLQLRGTSFGSNASTLEIITNSVQPAMPSTNNSLMALYSNI